MRDFEFADIAATLARAVSALSDTTGSRLPFVAVAHSLGGYLAITQQALFSSYIALAVLGCTNQHVAPLNLAPAFIARAATAQGRPALAREILSALPQQYFEGPREHLQSWFHLRDVPMDVVEADAFTAKSLVPRIFGTAMILGVVAEHAGQIDVPVSSAMEPLTSQQSRAPRPACIPVVLTSPRSFRPRARTATTWLPAGTSCGGGCSPGLRPLLMTACYSGRVIRPNGCVLLLVPRV